VACPVPAETPALAEPRALPWWQGWGPLLLLPGAVLLVMPGRYPPWVTMWALALVIYLGCKWLTWRRASWPGGPWWLHLGYLLAWPGLDAPAFLGSLSSSARPRPRPEEWLFALAKFLLGVGLFWGVARWLTGWPAYLVGWVGMVGLVLMLHFGIFHLLSCAWRSLGVQQARPLMNWPLASVSVSEFWGRRWNTAFRDLTHRFLFRPLTARFGPRWALFSGFVFSGVVHDLVISVPAGGGYGGPTLFFVLQGLALLVERSPWGRKIGLGSGWRGWAFTAGVLLAPAMALFHPPFVERVVVPFMQVVGACP
jgi:hypothetical protein